MTYIPSSSEEVVFLKNYDASKYQTPAIAADTALFVIDGSALKLLLIRRGNYPYKGCWALPGGFVDIDEEIAAAAKRELFEAIRPSSHDLVSRSANGSRTAY